MRREEETTLIEVIFVLGVTVPAFLSIYFEESTYSVASLIVTFISVSIFYFSLNAPLAAVFQLTLGVGTAVTLLLVSEEITTRTVETRNKNKIFLIVPFVLLLLLVTILEVPLLDISYLETPSNVPSLSISEILWSLRGIDALAQGLVVLTAVLTIAILLKKIGRGD